MSEKCPYCGSDNIQTERRLDGFHHCIDCRYSWKIGSSLPKQTVFEKITKSPETLAVELVTLDCDGWWAYVGIGTRETYPTREEAIAATVAKLKEVAE